MLGEQDGILKKFVTVVRAPTPHEFFWRRRALILTRDSAVILMIAPHALDAFEAFTQLYRDVRILLDSSRAAPETLAGLPPNYELTWNHTTPRALRVDPAITYLQVRYPAEGALVVIKRIQDRYGDEVQGHLEIIRFNGRIGFSGLPLVRFTTEARLNEVIPGHEAVAR